MIHRQKGFYNITAVLCIVLFIFPAAIGFSFPQKELHSEEKDQLREPSPLETEPGDELQPEEAPPEEAEEIEFIYIISPPEITLDPIHTFTSTEAQVYTALFEGLVTYHPFTLDPLPGMAERWEISSDKLTYTFHIRENAVYSNGDPILAEHFRATWLTLIDPVQKAEYASSIDMVKNAPSVDASSPVDRSFDILKGVSWQVNRDVNGNKFTTNSRWSIVYDATNLKVHFRTWDHQPVRTIDMTQLDFSCNTPSRVLDVNAELSGDVTDRFIDYTHLEPAERHQKYISNIHPDHFTRSFPSNCATSSNFAPIFRLPKISPFLYLPNSCVSIIGERSQLVCTDNPDLRRV